MISESFMLLEIQYVDLFKLYLCYYLSERNLVCRVLTVTNE